jgi:isoamylase
MVCEERRALAALKFGLSAPLGATSSGDTVNFSIFSRYATAIELLFFDYDDAPRPSRIVSIDPVAGRTYHYWHTSVSGVQPGQLYGYRVEGPRDPSAGLRFDSPKEASRSRVTTTARPQAGRATIRPLP